MNKHDDFLEHTGMTYTQMLMGIDLSSNQQYFTNMVQGPVVSEVSISFTMDFLVIPKITQNCYPVTIK